MRAPGRGRRATSFRLSKHLDGAGEITITVAPTENDFAFTVRPKGRHHTYTLPLSYVAEMVASRVAKGEAARNGAGR